MMFKKGQVVVAKDEYLDEGETVKGTAGIVLDHNPETDYLIVGVLHPEKYAVPPTFPVNGNCYRQVTEQEMKEWDIINLHDK